MQENDYSLYDYIKPILSATFIAVFSIAILTSIFSLVLTKIDLPFGLISPTSIAIIGISNFIGTFIAARRFGKKGLFIGLSASITLFIVILLVNLSIQPSGFGSIAIVKGVVTLFAGILGGVLGVNGKKRAKFKI